MGFSGHFGADLVDIAVELTVLHGSEIAGNLYGRILLVDLDFGIFGYQHQLLFAGDRVRGTPKHIAGGDHRG